MDIGALLGLEQLTWGTLILIVIAAFAAGWIDAVVGGGGLLQLPALLLIPGIAPVQALATNKLASVFGTATSSVTYYRRAKPDLRTALPMAFVALAGSFGGAAVATLLPASVFKPVIVIALIAVAFFTVFRPAMGAVTQLRFDGRRHLITASAAGAVIGSLLIEVIRNALLLAGVNPFWQGTFVGGFILFAVLLERARNVKS